MKVIDVSEHNGNIDYNKVKAAGCEGVVIRAGYGKGNEDKKFTRNITEAMKAGMHIGVYWFSYAYTSEMAKREAIFLDEKIAPYKPYLDMPVFFDWEYDSMNFAKKQGVNPDKKSITEMTRVFCEAITSMGYAAGYYLNQDYAKNYYDESKLTAYKRWMAVYRKADYKDCYLWQSGSSGKVDGINGSVDTDVLWGDLIALSQPIEDSVEVLPTTPTNASQGAQDCPYKVGDSYTISVKGALNVRKGPGTNYGLVGYNNLTPDGKKHACGSALKNGTKVTCQKVEMKSKSNIWLKIPSGWICAVDGRKVYVK